METSADTPVPTLETWNTPAFRRFSYQHPDKVFPWVSVPRGRRDVRPLEGPHPDTGLTRFEDARGKAWTVEDYFLQADVDAALILCRGRLAYEQYFGPMRPHTRHLLQSVTRSVVGLVAGRLVARGSLQTEALVTSYLPELRDSGYAGATLRHLLDMTTGIRFDPTDTNPDSPAQRLLMASGLKPGGGSRGLRSVLASLEGERPHGETFNYKGCDAHVLGWVCERASDLSLPELVGRELWGHLGTEHEAAFLVGPTGVALADRGFCANPRDLARLALVWLDHGRHGPEQVLPDWWLRDTAQGTPDVRLPPPFSTLLPHGSYRNQTWVINTGQGSCSMLGSHGQVVYLSPQLELAAVVVGSREPEIDPHLTDGVIHAAHAVARSLTS